MIDLEREESLPDISDSSESLHFVFPGAGLSALFRQPFALGGVYVLYGERPELPGRIIAD
jgi:hypothetical protein